MDTPFEYTKQVASDFGGTRNGMVISWPQGYKGEGRDPVTIWTCDRHCSDRLSKPRRCLSPKDGETASRRTRSKERALFYSFDSKHHAKETHTTQYFEMFGNRCRLQRRLVCAYDPPAGMADQKTIRPCRKTPWETLQLDNGFQFV
jgi:arylsulfatase